MAFSEQGNKKTHYTKDVIKEHLKGTYINGLCSDFTPIPPLENPECAFRPIAGYNIGQ